MNAGETIDPKTFWRTLGERATGVTVVTSRAANGPAGFLGLSASHVSADPPLMLVSIHDQTEALASVVQSGCFAINYLPADARELAEIFSGRRPLKGAERFEAGAWGELATGAPVLHAALGAFDCKVEGTHRYGTTTIVVGRVVALVAKGSGEPLLFFRGKYCDL